MFSYSYILVLALNTSLCCSISFSFAFPILLMEAVASCNPHCLHYVYDRSKLCLFPTLSAIAKGQIGRDFRVAILQCCGLSLRLCYLFVMGRFPVSPAAVTRRGPQCIGRPWSRSLYATPFLPSLLQCRLVAGCLFWSTVGDPCRSQSLFPTLSKQGEVFQRGEEES